MRSLNIVRLSNNLIVTDCVSQQIINVHLINIPSWRNANKTCPITIIIIIIIITRIDVKKSDGLTLVPLCAGKALGTLTP